LQNFCASENAVCSQILALTKQAMTFQKSLVSICRKLDSKVIALWDGRKTCLQNLWAPVSTPPVWSAKLVTMLGSDIGTMLVLLPGGQSLGALKVRNTQEWPEPIGGRSLFRHLELVVEVPPVSCTDSEALPPRVNLQNRHQASRGQAP